MKQKMMTSPCLRVDADLLNPGRGQPLRNGSLISSDGKILFVGKTEVLRPDYATISPITVLALMPGMWDWHVHFMGVSKTSVDDIAMVPPVVAGARSAKDIVATLNSGFHVCQVSGRLWF